MKYAMYSNRPRYIMSHHSVCFMGATVSTMGSPSLSVPKSYSAILRQSIDELGRSDQLPPPGLSNLGLGICAGY